VFILFYGNLRKYVLGLLTELFKYGTDSVTDVNNTTLMPSKTSRINSEQMKLADPT